MDERAAAHVGSCSKSRKIANDASAKRDDNVFSRKTVFCQDAYQLLIRLK